jgi:hypothetical protein
MFGIETLGGTERAAVLVGIVLLEAVLLYVGYGTLERLVGPVVTRVLKGDCAVGEALSGDCSSRRPRGE